MYKKNKIAGYSTGSAQPLTTVCKQWTVAMYVQYDISSTW